MEDPNIRFGDVELGTGQPDSFQSSSKSFGDQASGEALAPSSIGPGAPSLQPTLALLIAKLCSTAPLRATNEGDRGAAAQATHIEAASRPTVGTRQVDLLSGY